MADKPTASFTALRTPIVDPQTGQMSWEWTKWFQDAQLKLSSGLNQLGQLIGDISANTKISGRIGTIGDALKYVDPIGQFSAIQLSGIVAPASLPSAGIGSHGAVQAINPTTHQWVNSIDTSGVPQLSQPAFSDLSGSASAGQVPALSALSGSVTAGQVPALSGLSGRITTGQLPSSGLSVTITTAKLTTGGTTGSMTFTDGILTAHVDAT